MAREKGITLMDAMISVTILAIGFLMILTVIPGTGVFIKNSENKLIAKQLAQTYLELYASPQHWADINKTAGFSVTRTEPVTTTVNGRISSMTYTVYVTSSPFPGAASGELYNLNARVTWQEQYLGKSPTATGKIKQIELVTVVINPN